MSVNLLARRHSSYLPSQTDYSLYENQYMTTKALGSGTITFTIPAAINASAVVSVSYRKNGGAWTTTANSSSAVTISVNVVTNDVIEWKADATRFAASNSSGNYSHFNSTCQCNIYGNILSLLYENEFINKHTLKTNVTNAFNSIFNGWTNLIDASNLILPITEVSANYGTNMYACMFKDCTSLIYPPNELPEITALSGLSSVYVQMFEGCTSLIKCPDMDWGVLGNCNNATFASMFNGCTVLSQNIPNKIEVEEFSGTGNNSGLFRWMFQNCTHITTIPSLIIHNYTGAGTHVNHGVFNQTFRGCISLIDISNKTLSILNNSNCDSYYDFISVFCDCTSLQKTPLIKIPETHKFTFNRAFERVMSLTDLYLDIDTIYSTNTVTEEPFYIMFANTGETGSGSAYRGHNSMLHLYGAVNSASAFSNSHGIWGVTSSGSTGYAGWSPYWTVVEDSTARTLYLEDFPEAIDDYDMSDDHDSRNYESFVIDSIKFPDRHSTDTYFYNGDTITINDRVYHIWVPADVSWNGGLIYSESNFTLLTDTADFKRLVPQCLEQLNMSGQLDFRKYGNLLGANFSSLYAILSNDSIYKTGAEAHNLNYQLLSVEDRYVQ